MKSSTSYPVNTSEIIDLLNSLYLFHHKLKDVFKNISFSNQLMFG